MTPRLLAVLLALCPASRAQAQPGKRRVAIVVAVSDAARRVALDKISAIIQPRAVISVRELDETAVMSPIEKGKLVADLEAEDIVVSIGDAATAFATTELEGTPVFFVGAGTVSGESLASHEASGVFSYSVDLLLDAAKSLPRGKIGLAYTPGYEPVADWVRQGAGARGMTVVEKKIGDLKGFASAVRDLLDRSQTIWIVGDPLLVRGAGFEFLREQALSRKAAIIAPGLGEVQRGALIGFEPKSDTLAAQAGEILDSLLRGQTDMAASLRPAPRAGTVLVNGTLAQKWGITPPEGLPWRMVH